MGGEFEVGVGGCWMQVLSQAGEFWFAGCKLELAVD